MNNSQFINLAQVTFIEVKDECEEERYDSRTKYSLFRTRVINKIRPRVIIHYVTSQTTTYHFDTYDKACNYAMDLQNFGNRIGLTAFLDATQK